MKGEVANFRMETLEIGIVRFAIGMTATMLLASGLAMACPKGKHPVCHYDPNKSKSVCLCSAQTAGRLTQTLS